MENRSAANHRPQDATTLTTEWPTPDAQHKLRPFRCLITAGVIGGSVKRGTGHTSEASQPIVTCLVGPAANQKVPRQHERCSPDRAFVDWVHVGVGRAAEGLREIVQVLKRPDHPGDDNKKKKNAVRAKMVRIIMISTISIVSTLLSQSMKLKSKHDIFIKK